MRQRLGDNLFYILYFQEPGVAEAEFEADPGELLRRLYASPGMDLDPPEITDPRASAGGWLRRLPAPMGFPPGSARRTSTIASPSYSAAASVAGSPTIATSTATGT